MKLRLTLLTLSAALLAAPLAAQAAPENYPLDPTHTYASFQVEHWGLSMMRGLFDKSGGKFSFDRTWGFTTKGAATTAAPAPRISASPSPSPTPSATPVPPSAPPVAGSSSGQDRCEQHEHCCDRREAAALAERDENQDQRDRGLG